MSSRASVEDLSNKMSGALAGMHLLREEETPAQGGGMGRMTGGVVPLNWSACRWAGRVTPGGYAERPVNSR